MLIQTCAIPLPPSVNNLFLNTGKRRIKTPEYEAWMTEAIVRIRLALRPVHHYPVRVIVHVWGGTDFNKRRDVANCEKAATDALVKAGIIEDDCVKFVWDTYQRYRPTRHPKTRCELEVIEGIDVEGCEVAA